MRPLKKLVLETDLTAEMVVQRLSGAITKPRWSERLFPTKPSLAGEAQLDSVILYRQRGGRKYYGEFRGRLLASPRGSILDGVFLAYPARVLTFCSWFSFAWAGLVLLASIASWDASNSPVFLVAAAIAVGVGFGLPRFRQKNVELEADLLFEEIQGLLKEPSV